MLSKDLSGLFQASDKSFSIKPEEYIILSFDYVNNRKLHPWILELIENSKYTLWTDNDGNTIFHHLAFLMDRSNLEVKCTLIGVAERILKLMPRELRGILLDHENNDNKTAFTLAINHKLYGYAEKLFEYKGKISKKEMDEIRDQLVEEIILDMQEDDDKMEEAIAKYLERLNQIAIEHDYATISPMIQIVNLVI